MPKGNKGAYTPKKRKEAKRKKASKPTPTLSSAVTREDRLARVFGHPIATPRSIASGSRTMWDGGRLGTKSRPVGPRGSRTEQKLNKALGPKGRKVIYGKKK